MSNTNYYRIFISLVLIASLCQNCTHPSVKQPQESSTLLIFVDTNCVLYVDNTSYGISKIGDVKTVIVNRGQHLIITKNIDSSKVLLNLTIDTKDSTSRIIDLKMTRTSIDIKMIYVAGGTFKMGCTSEQGSDCEDDEKSEHTVTVNDFCIGKYEVTQAQWASVMGFNPSGFTGCDDCPVENVSWNDVWKFIKKLNEKTGKSYRLPTEAEWEYAARGGIYNKGFKYAGSNFIDDVAWYQDNSGSRTHRVGLKKPNELDIYDMSGNVWEWCNDWYGDIYYSSSPVNNPRGPSSGEFLVLRGGSWWDLSKYSRVSNRYRNKPSLCSDLFGFRLAMTSY